MDPRETQWCNDPTREWLAWPAIECTGVSAVWCPIHGDCACPDREDLNDDECPLHSGWSTHAADPEATA